MSLSQREIEEALRLATDESRRGTGATLASFPLTAVATANDIQVVFSHVVRGSSALTNCKDCAVPIGAIR